METSFSFGKMRPNERLKPTAQRLSLQQFAARACPSQPKAKAWLGRGR